MTDLNTSMKKRLVLGKGNSPGPHQVVISTPIPLRETPLKGLKKMATPKSDEFRQMFINRSLVEGPTPSSQQALNLGTSMGAVAFYMAIAVVIILLIHSLFGGPWLPNGVIFLGVAVFHLLVIFSQILSSGNDTRGATAMPILYGGIFCVIILEWLLV